MNFYFCLFAFVWKKKEKNEHLSISNSKRRRIYKIVKKKKRKEKNSKEAKNIYQKISKDCAIPTFLTSCRKTSKRGDDLFGSFFHRAYYFKPCVTRVVVGSLRRLVPAKCQSQETCQRRQMCRVSAASYRACASPRLAHALPFFRLFPRWNRRIARRGRRKISAEIAKLISS